MDSAFQELDYSDISAKHLSKRRKNSDINLKTRGGIIRLCSIIILIISILYLIIKIISKSKLFTNKEEELKTLNESKLLKEEIKKEEEDKTNYYDIEIKEKKINSQELSKQLGDISENIIKLEKSNNQGIIDIDNAKDSISNLENKLKVFREYKDKIDKLQKEIENLQKEIEEIKRE